MRKVSEIIRLLNEAESLFKKSFAKIPKAKKLREFLFLNGYFKIRDMRKQIGYSRSLAKTIIKFLESNSMVTVMLGTVMVHPYLLHILKSMELGDDTSREEHSSV